MICIPALHECTVKFFSLYSNITFQLHLSTGCNRIDRFDEGVEFSIRMNSERDWMPITLTTLKMTTLIGYHENEDDVEIRECHVKPIILDCPKGIYHSVQVCDFGFPVYSTQFRWLQTSIISNESKVKDAWTLDNVHISVYDGNNLVDLLQDSFNEPELK